MTWLAKESQNDGLNVTGELPIGVADGMTLIAFCSHEAGFGADTGLFTAVAGWTFHYSTLDTNGEDRVTGFYTRKASGEPASYVFPHASSTNSNTSVIIVATDEVDADDIFDVAFNEGTQKTTQNNSNSPGLLDITTTVDGAFALVFSTVTHDDITALGAPTNYTLLGGGIGGTYNDCQIMAAYRAVTTAGLESPGGWNNTDNGTSVAEATSLTIALNPAPAAGPTITDVDTDEEVTDGQAAATVSFSGFTGTPTLTLKYGAFETAALSYTGDETGGTWNVPDYAATDSDVTGVPVGQTVKLRAVNGAEVAEMDIIIQPKAGWNLTTISGAGTGQGHLPGALIADDSVAYFPDGMNVTEAAQYQADSYPANLVLWNSDTGIVEKVTVEEAGDPDIEAPVITLIGSYSPVILLGSAWAEPGYTATDNVDGDITNSVVVSGDAVDPNTLGMYAITYNVSDAAGNNALQVVRTVTVVDEISAGLASQFGMLGMM